MTRSVQRLAALTAVAGAALAAALPALAAPVPMLDVHAARAVASSFVVKATKKAGIKSYFLECSQIHPTSPVGPAVYTYLDLGSEQDAVVVVKKRGAYRVAGVVPVPGIDCGREWSLAA